MENIKKKSQFKNTIDEIEMVYNTNRGNGEFVRRDKTQLTELIKDTRLAVFIYAEATDSIIETNKAIIHYSKNGYHMVPTLRRFKELRKWKYMKVLII